MLKKIIKENVKLTREGSQVKLIIYYKTKRTSSPVIKKLLATDQRPPGNEPDI